MSHPKKELLKRIKAAKRLAVLGVGSALRSDDAAGLELIKELSRGIKSVKPRLPLKLFSCSSAPENFTGPVRRFAPTHIIIADSAEMGNRAGCINIIETVDLGWQGSFGSTHRLSLKVLSDYFSAALQADTVILGIQPGNVDFGLTLSAPVKRAVKDLSFFIQDAVSFNPFRRAAGPGGSPRER